MTKNMMGGLGGAGSRGLGLASGLAGGIAGGATHVTKKAASRGKKSREMFSGLGGTSSMHGGFGDDNPYDMGSDVH